MVKKTFPLGRILVAQAGPEPESQRNGYKKLRKELRSLTNLIVSLSRRDPELSRVSRGRRKENLNSFPAKAAGKAYPLLHHGKIDAALGGAVIAGNPVGHCISSRRGTPGHGKAYPVLIRAVLIGGLH